jgi:hypothetical protein
VKCCFVCEMYQRAAARERATARVHLRLHEALNAIEQILLMSMAVA